MIDRTHRGRPGIVPVVLMACGLSIAACAGPSPETVEPLAGSTDPIDASTTTSTNGITMSSGATATPPSSEDPGADGCPPQQPGRGQMVVTAESNVYSVQTYVPAAYGPEPLPAVINWHGLGSNGFQHAVFTDYENLAEQEGFIVVHPTGLATGLTGGARGWELDQFDVAGRDDVAMAEVLIDRLVADFCADPRRIYSTGMSNGGFFTARLVCELADRIAAAVSVAGISHHDGCRPTRAVPYLVVHGTADAVVPFSGGDSTLASGVAPAELEELFDQVIPEELAEFAADFGCEPEPRVAERSDEVIAYDYQGCANGIPVTFVEVVDGGHTWPGSPLGPILEGFVGKTTDDISATSDGWAFMSEHSLDD